MPQSSVGYKISKIDIMPQKKVIFAWILSAFMEIVMKGARVAGIRISADLSGSVAVGGEPDADGLALADNIAGQLKLYLLGKLQVFDFDLERDADVVSTPFRMKVWKALMDIGYGRTVSYSELAIMAGSPGAARSVAGAVAANPLPLLVPCHRVVCADGTPGEYCLHSIPASEGRALKKRLLRLEKGESVKVDMDTVE